MQMRNRCENGYSLLIMWLQAETWLGREPSSFIYYYYYINAVDDILLK